MLVQDQFIGLRIEKCVVERLIGRGGYGVSYLAFDEELQEHKVIKVSQTWSDDEGAQRRNHKSFIEEGLILSRLKHPQIVTLRGQGDRHGHRYMILDYIHGFSLKAALDIVARRCEELQCRWEDLMDPVTASALVLSSLHPLAYAHRANVHLPDREIFGVAHRDISPGNLILGTKGNEKGRVVLIDFGTAKTDLTDSATVNQNLIGTVPYMSKSRLQKAAAPEQVEEFRDFWRDFKETQNDIHAMGVLYYQLLTGRLAFPGETSPQIIVKILDPGSYTRCLQEVASAFPFAAALMRKTLVYHDFSQPLHEQPYQYPDAPSMLRDMEEVFQAASSGRTVQEVLLDFVQKLSQPETLQPARLRQTAPVPFAASRHGTEAPIPAVAGETGRVSASRKHSLSPTTAWWTEVSKGSRPYATALWVGGALACALSALAWWEWQKRPARLAAQIPQAAGHMAPRLEKLDEVKPLPAEPMRTPDAAPPPSGAPSAGPKPAKPRPSKPGSAPTHRLGSVVAQALQAVAEKNASSDPGEGSAGIRKEIFVQLQTLVRTEDAGAFEKLSEWLAKYPDSPDLRLLRCQLVLKRNPASEEARQDLMALQEAAPVFIHANLFHENAMYLLWQVDATRYSSQPSPATRINLLKSANAYLSEFQPNQAYAAKIKGIRESLPK